MASPPRDAPVPVQAENTPHVQKIKRYAESPVVADLVESIMFLGESQIHRICETCHENDADAPAVTASYAYLLKETLEGTPMIRTAVNDDGQAIAYRAEVTMRTECVPHMKNALLALALREDSKKPGRVWSSARIFVRSVCSMCLQRMWASDLSFTLAVEDKEPQRFCVECAEIMMFGTEGTTTKAARPKT